MQHAGERLDRVVVREHRVVVDLARDGDLVLGLGELAPGAARKFSSRLQLGIRLGDGEQAAERLAEDALGRAGSAAEALRACAAARACGDRLERPALVRRVALDRLDEVRDQVAAPLELHLDLRPGVVDAVAQPDEPVVERDQEDREERRAARARR